MTDILVYTTEKKLLHKQGKLEDDDDYSEEGVYFWSFWNLPKIQVGDRAYFAINGHIVGYFVVKEVDKSCRSIVWDAESWKSITPVPTVRFQGFKYVSEKYE